MKSQLRFLLQGGQHFRGLVVLALVAFCGGCATSPKPVEHWTFFPHPPDQPRIQFLTSFTSDRDLGRDMTFTEYLTGRPQEVVQLVKPYGLACWHGQIRVCDTSLGAVQIYDFTKKQARYFAPKGNGKLIVPINLTVDADGNHYIADTGRNQVLIFGPDEQFAAALGAKDEMKPTDVAVANDRLYVTDLKHSAVRVYSKAERNLLFTIPREPVNETNRLYQPTNLAFDPNGHLLVSDTGGFRVQVYDADGNFQRTIGQQGIAPGYFARPKGVAVSRDGTTYVVDASTQVVQMFDAQGRLLMYFGQPGDSETGELLLPAAVKVDYENLRYFQAYVAPGFRLQYLILVTSQFGPARVNVYGFLEKI